MYIWLAGALAGLFILYFFVTRKSNSPVQAEVIPDLVPEIPSRAPSSHKAPPKVQKSAPAKVAHKELIDSYKGLQGPVVDFDMKENYFAICCDDGTVRIYKISSPTDTKAKYVHGILEKNQPTAIALNSSGNIAYVGGSQDLQIHQFKVQQTGQKRTLEVEKVFAKKHFLKISSLCYTPTCLISCGEEQDITIHIWSHTGELLFSHENKQLKHKRMLMSKDYKFFSIVTWLGSARIFEITKEKKTQNFSGIRSVMELGGHSQGLSTLAFSADSHLAVTCSHDHNVKLWNINVQYELRENPVLLKTLKLEDGMTVPSACAVSEKRVVLACDGSIRIYSVPNLELINVIEDAHNHEISKIDLIQDTLITCAAEPRIHLWHID